MKYKNMYYVRDSFFDKRKKCAFYFYKKKNRFLAEMLSLEL